MIGIDFESLKKVISDIEVADSDKKKLIRLANYAVLLEKGIVNARSIIIEGFQKKSVFLNSDIQKKESIDSFKVILSNEIKIMNRIVRFLDCSEKSFALNLLRKSSSDVKEFIGNNDLFKNIDEVLAMSEKEKQLLLSINLNIIAQSNSLYDYNNNNKDLQKRNDSLSDFVFNLRREKELIDDYNKIYKENALILKRFSINFSSIVSRVTILGGTLTASASAFNGSNFAIHNMQRTNAALSGPSAGTAQYSLSNLGIGVGIMIGGFLLAMAIKIIVSNLKQKAHNKNMKTYSR